ncbi:MAG: hypothetical protein ACRD6N_01765 [Pyrinomonadaceae bacterium]
MLFAERLLKFKSACSRTIQNAGAYSKGVGRITADAREKDYAVTMK